MAKDGTNRGGKHPTMGATIVSPFVAMSQPFGKQANVYWYEIFEIVQANCTTDYSGEACWFLFRFLYGGQLAGPSLIIHIDDVGWSAVSERFV